MNSIADALVYAVAHIGCREDVEDDGESDSEALDHIGAYLANATREEEDVLAEAAQRALAEEKSLFDPNPEMVKFFENWMQFVFRWDWEGNERVGPEEPD